MPHNHENQMPNPSPEDVKQALEQLGPAVIGTAVSMLFTDGSWKKRLFQGAVGVPFSLYMAPSVGAHLSRFGWEMQPEAVGVLTGVFGITCVSYVFELWKQLQIGPMLREWLAKRMGVNRDV